MCSIIKDLKEPEIAASETRNQPPVKARSHKAIKVVVWKNLIMTVEPVN
jgi:hypothetical protein